MKKHCRRLAFLAFLLGILLVPAAFAVEPAPEQAGFPEEEEEVVKRTPFEELAAANGERFVNPLSMSVAGGLRALGLTPQPPTTPAIGDEIVAHRGRTRAPLPPAADNSAGLPPVGDQGAQGSCVSWAVGYYLKSYQEGREHGWDLGDPAHQFSPAFLFNQLSVNYEPEEGYWLVSNTTFDYVFNQVLRHGCCSLAAMPYNDADYRTWPSAAAFKEAIPYRAESYAYIGHGQMDATLPAVKEILASGDLVVVGIPIYRPDRTTPGRFDLLAAGDADYEMPPISDNYLAGYHALTIVGYDESKFAGVGGYKIVNSWGAEWGDAGFAWLSEPFLTKFGTAFYTMTDRIGYQPTAMVHWKVGHSWWGPTYDAVTVSVGVGPKDRPLWSTKMVGGVLREDSWLCVDMWYDVSEAADYLPATWEQSWWLKVTDSYVAYAPTVYTFEIESGGTTADAAPMLPLEGNFFAYTHYFDVPCGEAASANYYVNDDSVAGDQFCTAPGDDANDGLTPATPKRTIQAIIDRYTLQGGNTVWIDAGEYRTDKGICLDYRDRGAEEHWLTFQGAVAPNGEPAVSVRRTDSAGPVFSVADGSRYVQLSGLRLTGGMHGIAINDRWTSSLTRDYFLENLRISDTIEYGCYLYQAAGTLRHSIIHDAGWSGCFAAESDLTLEHCTVVASEDHSAVAMYGSGKWYGHRASVSVRDSVLVANGNGWCVAGTYEATLRRCDWSLLFHPDGRLLAQGILNSSNMTEAPLFADPANGDFHLQSEAGRWDPAANDGFGGWVKDAQTSPAIDRGDLDADASQEPGPNGRRINIGAYGGTPFASMSPSSIAFIEPKPGTEYRQVIPIRWELQGNDWLPGDTVRIEYSTDGGETWSVIPDADTMDAQARIFDWDIWGCTAATSVSMRIVCNRDMHLSGLLLGTFAIATARQFYVNDASTVNDAWCTAPGDDESHDGLSPGTPKATVQSILTDYDLEPGDIVFIDTGIYVLSADINLNSSANQVSFEASPFGVTFDRNDTNTGTAWMINASGVTIRTGKSSKYPLLPQIPMRITGANIGVYFNQGGGTVSGLWCDNNIEGIHITSPSVTVEHCVINGSRKGIYIYGSAGAGIVRNCTVIGVSEYGSGGIYLANASRLNLTNSIVVANGTGTYAIYASYGTPVLCDYNNLVTLNGADVGCIRDPYRVFPTLSDWQVATGRDAHSISLDPLFVDPPNGDYHLQSTAGSYHGALWTADVADSPCIDAGDPTTPVGDEPTPNGKRVEIGAYGGTAQASKTPTERRLVFTSPVVGDFWSGIRTVGWRVIGDAWQDTDTVRVEYSPDGATWQLLPGGDALLAASGEITWDTRTATPDTGLEFAVRITCNQAPEATFLSASFALHNAGISYYVNDASTILDEWCTGPGLDDFGRGVDPATPAATVQWLLSEYDLEPGDIVYIDTGTYNLTSNIMIAGVDSGNASAPVIFRCAPYGVTFNRGSTASTSYGWEVTGAYVTLETGRGVRHPEATQRYMQVMGAYHGVYVAADYVRIARCEILSNRLSGVYVNGSYTDHTNHATIENCLLRENKNGVYANDADHITVSNCTMVGNWEGVCLVSSVGNTVQNTIIVADGSNRWGVYLGSESSSLSYSDYNLFCTVNGASVGYPRPGYAGPQLGDWQTATGKDRHSISADPLFVDALNGDFHLQSSGGSYHGGAWGADAADSPCIDMGDPATPVGDEPSPNGGRVNLGAYGGTEQASKTPVARILHLLAPLPGQMWSGSNAILWNAVGQGWADGDTVRIELSVDGGTTWATIPDADAIPALAGEFAWDTTTAVPNTGHAFLLRIVSNQDAAVSATMTDVFTLHNSGITYYVNDALTDNDAWCTAAGDDANNGLTPATPKATVQAILADYDLEPGDTVRIDTGTYDLDSNVKVTSADAGSTAGPVTFELSPYGVTFDRGSTASNAYCCWAIDGSYVIVTMADSAAHPELPKQWPKFTGGVRGISVSGQYCHLAGLDSVGNLYEAISLGASNATVTNCLARGSTSSTVGTGIYIGASNASVTNCTVTGNGKRGICVWAFTGTATLRNNIVQSDGAGTHAVYRYSATLPTLISDYNNLFADNGAAVGYSGADNMTLADWQVATGLDAHSISVDPLFVDPANGDFHLQSTAGSYHGGLWTADAVDSPCLDAGDPATGVGDEPAPNGQRINLGAYGGTEQASKSHVRRSIQLTSPVPGTLLKSSAAISWLVFGDAWQPGDTVSIEWSADGGATWRPVTGGAGLDADSGVFSWSLFGLEWGDSYRIRLTCDQDAASTFSSADFSVGGMYYVNDDSLEGDVYCSATGDDDANHGRSTASPKASIQAILDAYDLEPGDTVYVDTGTFVSEATIKLGPEDYGNPAAYVRIVGAGMYRTLLERHLPSSWPSDETKRGVIRIDGTSSSGPSYVSVEDIALIGGVYGVNFSATECCHLIRCRVFGNSQTGIKGARSFRITVKNCLVYSNGMAGISLESGGGSRVENSTVALNGGPQVHVDYYRSWSDACRIVGNLLWAEGPGTRCLSYWHSTDNITEKSDFNCLYVSGGATVGVVFDGGGAVLTDWQTATGLDLHSISVDPLFADPASGDFHLKSTVGRWNPAANGGAGGWVVDEVMSPCIDAGDPAAPVGGEPLPHGGRINLGAYGGTSEASKSPERFLVFLGTGEGSELRTWMRLAWEARGEGWQPGDTVRIEYCVAGRRDGWQTVPGCGSLAYGDGATWWDSRALGDGQDYSLRVVCNANPAVTGTDGVRYTVFNSLAEPYNPTPVNTAQGVPINTDLAWHDGGGSDSYDIYVWTGGERPAEPTATGLTLPLYDPPAPLAFDTEYKWQVVAHNAVGERAGRVWTFKTRHPPADLYVDANGVGNEDADGSQGRPFTTIMTALNAVAGTETYPINVHVAEGVYSETVTMHAYENLYGGYRSVDWARDVIAFPTIIDGEGARRCVWAASASNSRLDGFLVRNGTDGGGGMFIRNSTELIIANCTFSNCITTNQGGAFYVDDDSEVLVTNCIFADNHADRIGGAISVYWGSTLRAVNSLFVGNTASTSGGGINQVDATATALNCIFWNNSTDLGGGATATYSCIEDGDEGEGNISADPCFVDAANGDYRLLPGSPCIDAGRGDAEVGVPDTDLPGNPRHDDAGMPNVGTGAPNYVDMGAFERQTDSDLVLNHLAWTPIASPQTAAVGFPVELVACNVAGKRIATYAGEVSLSAMNDSGELPLAPATVALANGRWSGSLAIHAVGGNVRIAANDGDGHTATSNAFDLVPGPLHHFEWNAIASPQRVNVPFPVTVTARDKNGFRVEAFDGTVGLGGFIGARSTARILGNVTHYGSASENFTLGYAFTPSSDLIVTHVRRYFGTKVTIWTDTGTLLASKETSGPSGVWTEVELDAPLTLTGGTTYRVAAYAAGRNYYGVGMGATFPHGTIVQGYTVFGDAFPNRNDGVKWYFVDLVYSIVLTPAVPMAPAVSGAFVSGAWSGEVTVAQTATGMHLAADDGAGHISESTTFDVLKRDQTITLVPDPLPVKTYGDPPFVVSATATSGLPVTLASDNEAVATVTPAGGDAWTVTIRSAGTTNITASQPGDDGWNAAPAVVQELVVQTRPLAVTPVAGQSKVFGTADPAFAYGHGGAVAGEIPAFAGALTRAEGDAVGRYAITRGTLALADKGAFLAANYTLAFTEGVTFAITAKDASTLTIADIDPMTYDGTAKTPEPEVKDGDKALVQGVDYMLTYTANTNAGTATVTVNGQGNYGGTQDKTFTINKIALAVTPVAGQSKVFGADDPAFAYGHGGAVAGETPAFAGALTRDEGEAVGEYAITRGTLALVDNGSFLTANYSLAFTEGVTFAIIAKDASTLTIADIDPMTYDGTAKTPEPEVKDGDKVLVQGVDYTLTYTANTNAGTGTVTVNGQGNYGGAKDKTFTINKATAAVTLANLTHVYDGTAKAATATTEPPGLTVKLTYNGGQEAPVNAGEYVVAATVDEQNWQGAAEDELVIGKAAPTITWAPPAPIVAGMGLSAMQLNAIADVPGAFVYDPPAGTALPAGVHALTAAFTPDDAVNWALATDEAELRVVAGTVMWLTAAPGNGEAPITLAFGETETAAHGEDVFDVAAIPGQGASLRGLPMSGSGNRRLSHDFRSLPGENGTTRWRLEIAETGRRTGSVTLTWDIGAATPGRQLYLQQVVDEQPAGYPIDMRAVSSATVSSGSVYEIAYAPTTKASVTLTKGWNFMGCPVMATQSARESLDSLIHSTGDLSVLWHWQDGGYKILPVDEPLRPEAGYFVYSHEDKSLSITGIKADGVMLLQPGWNLVSPPSDCQLPAAEGIAGQAWQLHADAYRMVVPGGMLGAGNSYWIFVGASRPIMVDFGQ